MTSRKFTWSWVTIFAVTVVVFLVFPAVIYGLTLLSDCQSVSGACGALFVVAAIGFRIPIVGAFIILISRLVWRRSGAVGLRVWAMPLTLFMLLAMLPLLLTFRDFRSPVWGMDVLSTNVMAPVLYLLLVLVTLSTHPGPNWNDDASHRKWRGVLAFMAIPALVLTGPAWATGLSIVPFLWSLAASFHRVFYLLRPEGLTFATYDAINAGWLLLSMCVAAAFIYHRKRVAAATTVDISTSGL
jgi:hypothetical protein